jgi:hypothetical protein
MFSTVASAPSIWRAFTVSYQRAEGDVADGGNVARNGLEDDGGAVDDFCVQCGDQLFCLGIFLLNAHQLDERAAGAAAVFTGDDDDVLSRLPALRWGLRLHPLREASVASVAGLRSPRARRWWWRKQQGLLPCQCDQHRNHFLHHERFSFIFFLMALG